MTTYLYGTQGRSGANDFFADNRWFSRYVIAAMLVDGKQKIAH